MKRSTRIALETLACIVIAALGALMVYWFPVWGHALASK